jgi:Domain of unknown function (DUF4386)
VALIISERLTPGRLQALARLFTSLQGAGYLVGLVFFGLGPTVFAYLWLKSRYIPRALAALGVFSSLLVVVVTLAIMVFLVAPPSCHRTTLCPALSSRLL